MSIIMIKKKIKIIFLTLLLFFIGYYLFFLVFPIIFIGPPMSIYDIRNMDSITHNVSVEIFDSNNNSMYLKTYMIQPDRGVEFERQINWFIPIIDEFITWSHGTYTFRFSVDNNFSRDITAPVRTWQTVDVWVYYQGPQDIEVIPIEIKIVTV
jgi:hypothetical protein